MTYGALPVFRAEALLAINLHKREMWVENSSSMLCQIMGHDAVSNNTLP